PHHHPHSFPTRRSSDLAESIPLHHRLHRAQQRRLRARGAGGMTSEEVARRHANRPGYTLVSYGEVGLPFYRIQLRVEVLEHKEIDRKSTRLNSSHSQIS